MSLKLNQLDAGLRSRIEKQIHDEDSASLSRHRGKDNPDTAGVCPAQPKSVSRKTLDQKARTEAGGAGGSEPGAHYRIEYTIYAVQPCDWDNIAAGTKWLSDGIVSAGWLPDDGWRSLEGGVRAVKASSVALERTVAEITRIA